MQGKNYLASGSPISHYGNSGEGFSQSCSEPELLKQPGIGGVINEVIIIPWLQREVWAVPLCGKLICNLTLTWHKWFSVKFSQRRSLQQMACSVKVIWASEVLPSSSTHARRNKEKDKRKFQNIFHEHESEFKILNSEFKIKNISESLFPLILECNLLDLMNCTLWGSPLGLALELQLGWASLI